MEAAGDRIERSSPIPKRILEEKSSPGKRISACNYFLRPKSHMAERRTVEFSGF